METKTKKSRDQLEISQELTYATLTDLTFFNSPQEVISEDLSSGLRMLSEDSTLFSETEELPLPSNQDTDSKDHF